MKGNDFLVMAQRVSCEECADSVDAAMAEVYAEGREAGLEEAEKLCNRHAATIKAAYRPGFMPLSEEVEIQKWNETADEIRALRGVEGK